jgi:methyl-accepting chemotaxis protein
MSESQAKSTTYEQISKLSYGKDGYFFILSESYQLLSLKDVNENFFSKEIVDKVRVNKEGFVTYSGVKSLEKLSYIKKFEPWNIYVGTGIYTNEISSMVEDRKKELFNSFYKIIEQTKITDQIQKNTSPTTILKS